MAQLDQRNALADEGWLVGWTLPGPLERDRQ
jgi:hypothetical protein